MSQLVDMGEMEVQDMSVGGFSPVNWLLNNIVIIKPTEVPPLVAITYKATERQVKNLAAAIGAKGANVELRVELEKEGITVSASDIVQDDRTTIAVDGPTCLSLRQLTPDMKPTGLWYCLFTRVRPGRKYRVQGRPAELSALSAHELQSLVNEQQPAPSAGAGAAGAGAGP